MLSPADELRSFAYKVVEEARANALSMFPKGGGELSSSIDWDINVTRDNVQISFEMEEYGVYKDAGVFGAMRPSTQKMAWATKNIKQKGKKVDSVFLNETVKAFSYKNKAPRIESLEPWIKRNKVRFRTPKGQKGGGQFRKGSYQTIAYWMAQRVFAQGLVPSLFFTKPFYKHFVNLSDDIAQAIADALEKQITNKK